MPHNFVPNPSTTSDNTADLAPDSADNPCNHSSLNCPTTNWLFETYNTMFKLVACLEHFMACLFDKISLLLNNTQRDTSHNPTQPYNPTPPQRSQCSQPQTLRPWQHCSLLFLPLPLPTSMPKCQKPTSSHTIPGHDPVLMHKQLPSPLTSSTVLNNMFMWVFHDLYYSLGITCLYNPSLVCLQSISLWQWTG